MRQIRFRAWDENYSKYTYSPTDMDMDVFWENVWSGHIGLDGVEEFTGLLDKDGREIYEGDVVESKIHNPSRMEIRFLEGGFCAWWGDDDYPIDINHFYDSKGCCIRVVGNIHEGA